MTDVIEFRPNLSHDEYWRRVQRLMLRPRSMTLRAAETVVSAAMFGIGCTEGTVRAKIQATMEEGNA